MDEPDSSDIHAAPRAAPRQSSRWLMAVIWPAFVLAGVLAGLVFALIDPADLAWVGAEGLNWSRQAIYTGRFLVFWLLISLAASISVLLAVLPEPPVDAHPRQWPR